MDEILQQIAQRHLYLGTLETRNMDDLDFSEQAVWAIRAALEEAYQAGRQDVIQNGEFEERR